MPTVETFHFKAGTGTLTHGKNKCNDGTWRRCDTWKFEEERPEVESCISTGPDDDSERFSESRNGKYNPVCSCCYLHFSHTVDYHNRGVKAYNDREGIK